MASKVSIISTCTIKSSGRSPDNCKIIELTPWDIYELQIEYGQSGLLYPMPTFEQVRDLSKSTNTTTLIDHLRVSLSRTLDFFPPFCGRLEAAQEEKSGTTCFFVNCNNVGVQFNHAIADGVTVGDIMESNLVPHVVNDFFPLTGVQNTEATSQPFLAVQVTELVDGIFIGCAANHALVDGSSYWHFYNSWAEISRGCNVISKIPYLKRKFPFKMDHSSDRIYVPNERINAGDKFTPPALREKVFHFSRENVSKLKAKANHQMNTTKISSLQAVLAHLWQSVIRCRRLDHSEETTFEVSIDMRKRLNPPLPEGFFGNAIYPAPTTIKTGELLEHGFGWAALQINKTIATHDHEKLKCIYENWMNEPEVTKLGDLPSNYFMLNGSPQFNFYKYDFGWGKPIAHRGGVGNLLDGKITVSPGLGEGSMIVEICLSSETIQALEEDIIFGEFVNTTPMVAVEPTIRSRI
ncbi:protein ENHANCED PSEUDOMONAS SUSCEPTIBILTY 1-like [Solanum pennellii]|uniref:Protein ENHANCED PSEUDOMONAS SUSCEPTIBILTY 1-like n=1 Tax=Solanum pennellii TaxID=28526 RepID=A0ABM1FIX0_SOLPN|nr:protein ENHANCED PSEUDOMONAS SUSCEPTIBILTY 1-like [Solanum pennellii]